MQEAWRTKPINNIYRFWLSLLSNQEMYNAEVLVLMSSEKLHRKKKLPGSDSKAFTLNSACEWEFFPPVSLKQNRTTTMKTPKTNSVSSYWLFSQPETVWRALYSSMDERRHQGIQAHIPSQITKCGHANQTQPRRSCKSWPAPGSRWKTSVDCKGHHGRIPMPLPANDKPWRGEKGFLKRASASPVSICKGWFHWEATLSTAATEKTLRLQEATRH